MVFLIAALFNLGLNLLLVPKYGYFWAATSTALTYLLVILYFAYRDPSLLSTIRAYRSQFVKFSVLLGLQVLLFLLVEKYDPSMPAMIGMGLIFVLSYGWLLKSQGFLQSKLESDEN